MNISGPRVLDGERRKEGVGERRRVGFLEAGGVMRQAPVIVQVARVLPVRRLVGRLVDRDDERPRREQEERRREQQPGRARAHRVAEGTAGDSSMRRMSPTMTRKATTASSAWIPT